VVQILSAAAATAVAILEIFVVIVVAGLLVRRGVLTDRMVTALSTTTVVLFLPCLIFDKIVGNFAPGRFPLWWALPLSAVAMAAVGLVAAAALFARELPAKRNLLPLAGIQNAGYLILPVGMALYPERFDEFALYVSLFILGLNPVLWSVGKLLTTAGGHAPGGWRGLVNPPLVACVTALTVGLTGTGHFIPRPLIEAVELVGQGAVPAATVVLGAMLGGMHIRLRPHVWDAVRVLSVKYLVVPAVTVAALALSGIGETAPLLASFLVLESAAAPAAGLILQVRTYGGDETTIGSLMLASYVACLVSLPLWLAVWDAVAG
jgi:predicted permease